MLTDSQAINQIIGCIYNNPLLLEDDRYKFSEKDFPESFHRNIFGSMYNLFQGGARKMDIVAIENYLEQRPSLAAEYKVNNGAEYIIKCSQISERDSFPYYYMRMKKMTLLREYQKNGFNVSLLYNPDNVSDLKLRQKQEDWLDNHSLDEISDIIDGKLHNIRAEIVDGSVSKTIHMSDGIEDYLYELTSNPDYGVPLYGPYINTITRGARLGKLYLRSAATNVGKAIPTSTVLPTPNGWRLAGDIKIGDTLFGQNGKPTIVMGVFPQRGKRKIWKVVLKDGRIAYCSGDHLWGYYIGGGKNGRYMVESTKEMYQRFYGTKHSPFYLPNCKPVDYAESVNLKVSPYLMGILAGKGAIIENKNITDYVMFRAWGWDGYQEKRAFLTQIVNEETQGEWNLVDYNDPNIKHGGLLGIKKSNGEWLQNSELFDNVPEGAHFNYCSYGIPEEYLVASVNERYELLRGIIDACHRPTSSRNWGHICLKFRGNKLDFLHSLRQLLYSLGFNFNVYYDKPKKHFEVSIHINRDMAKLLTLKETIKNDMDRFKWKDEKSHSTERRHKSQIVDIIETEDYTDMICFRVNAPDSLFLMNDYITTHNTRMFVADVCNFGCDEIYNLQKNDWVKNGDREPTLFIATEQDINEIQLSCLAFLSGVEEEHIKTNRYENNEHDRVKYAIDVLKHSNIFFESMTDYGMKDIENCVKRNIRENGILYACVDYIHSSIGVLEEITKRAGGVKLREDQILFMMMAQLKEIAMKYNVFVATSSQLNGQYVDASIYDQNLLRGSKASGDVIDWGSIVLETTDKDRESLQPLIDQLGLPMPNVKQAIYKNRGNRWKNILLWMNADQGTCRYETLFATQYNYQRIDLPDTVINIRDKESLF